MEAWTELRTEIRTKPMPVVRLAEMPVAFAVAPADASSTRPWLLRFGFRPVGSRGPVHGSHVRAFHVELIVRPRARSDDAPRAAQRLPLASARHTDDVPKFSAVIPRS